MCSLIKKHEGLRLQAYKCPAGVWTIGYGTTRYPDGRPIGEGDLITQDHAEALLTDYLMREVYPAFGKMPFHLTERQKNALSSLIYNWKGGYRSFLKSKLYQALCRRDWAAVCREWDYGFKNGFLGLFKRRTEELALFMGDVK